MTVLTSPTDVYILSQWLAGDHSNWEQAIENPPFFAHIRVGIRALPNPITPEGVWLYLEQAYDYELNHPYRTAVLHLIYKNDRIEMINYKLKNATEFFGASRDRDRLAKIDAEAIDQLHGCTQWVYRADHQTFKGSVESGKKCCINRKGVDTYLSIEFEVTEKTYSSLDRGYDIVTDEMVWGSVAGAFQFTKKFSFSDEIPLGSTPQV
ncbi:chromophore lyase CpcT/CpeT [Pseudanabaena sp. FACHB-1998]|uniref:chromophore lyase CpcT/CpeT n=1 Tax=Pseudanabaena sp. FACHB-1998 TaxID=2692858 RepID=UPI0016804839|nr:chromophore lyase CpcT/CpeT [Pseudanabaena sp. FACHB-1998]MBD2175668.1 chromophore lyase CpcT/CpeT [Pseudanabaena sp. FACHB-1998]